MAFSHGRWKEGQRIFGIMEFRSRLLVSVAPMAETMSHLPRSRPQKMPLRVISRNPDAVRRTYSDRHRSTVLVVALAAFLILMLGLALFG